MKRRKESEIGSELLEAKKFILNDVQFDAFYKDNSHKLMKSNGCWLAISIYQSSKWYQIELTLDQADLKLNDYAHTTWT